MAGFSLFDHRGLQALSQAEFSESLYSLIGNSYFDRSQAYLIFSRYD